MVDFREKVRMTNWCERHRSNPSVQQWLLDNPPPKGWQGTRLEWAYVEMPAFSIKDDK